MVYPGAGIPVSVSGTSWGTSLTEFGSEAGVATSADPGTTVNVPMVADGSHGQKPSPSGALGTGAFAAAYTLPSATSSVLGGVELNTDLGGTATAPNVVGLRGLTLPTLASATGLFYDNAGTLALDATLPTAAEPAHTGDVTNTVGSLAMTIAANAVTLAKQATNTANTLQGFNGSGVASDVAIGTGLNLTGGTLSATGTGNITSITGSGTVYQSIFTCYNQTFPYMDFVAASPTQSFAVFSVGAYWHAQGFVVAENNTVPGSLTSGTFQGPTSTANGENLVQYTSGSVATGATAQLLTGPPFSGTASISSFTGTSGTLTFTTATNNLTANATVILTGFTGGNTGLNNQIVTVLAAGLTSTSFEAVVTGSGYSSGSGTETVLNAFSIGPITGTANTSSGSYWLGATSGAKWTQSGGPAVFTTESGITALTATLQGATGTNFTLPTGMIGATAGGYANYDGGFFSAASTENGTQSLYVLMSVANSSPGNLGTGSASSFSSGAVTVKACGLTIQ
jgi:hypothetical protein